MAGPAAEITADTTAEPSVRASLLACSGASLLALWIAAIEMPMADLPSGFMFFPVLPLTALAFVGCCLGSALLLTRIRRHGARFAAPFTICALTLALLTWAPFTQIWLQGNFLMYRTDRERIVARVERGELVPNVAHNRNLIALGNSEPNVSVGGNDIVVDQAREGTYVLFLTLRGFRHYFSGFLHVPSGGDPAKFFEFEDAPPKQMIRYGEDWYFVAN
jgi:hypothetical protein